MNSASVINGDDTQLLPAIYKNYAFPGFQSLLKEQCPDTTMVVLTPERAIVLSGDGRTMVLFTYTVH